MALSTEQATAFETAAGFTPQAGFSLWAGILLAFVFFWAAWSLVVVYKGWAAGDLKAGAGGGAVIRLLVLICILSFLVLS